MDKRIVIINKLKSFLASFGISGMLLPLFFYFPNSMLLAAVLIMLEGKMIFDFNGFMKAIKDLKEKVDAELQSKEWNDLSSKYNEVLSRINLLMKHLEINSPLEIYSLYVYLYRSGYLSYNKEFVCSYNDVKDIVSLYGIDVIRGKGCCRNISIMLKGLYNLNGFDNYTFSVLSLTEFIKENNSMSLAGFNHDVEIEENDEFSKILNSLQPLLGNHLINCVRFDDSNCWLDPTNDLLLFRKDKKLYTSFNDEPIFSKISLFNVDGVKNFDRKEFFSASDLTFEDYKAIYEKTNRIIKANQDVFERFYLDNKDSYVEIFELMEKYPFSDSETVKSKKLFIKE